MNFQPTEHEILADFVRALKEIVNEEFWKLEVEERAYLVKVSLTCTWDNFYDFSTEQVDNLLYHKLTIPFKLRNLAAKVEEFEKSSMTKEEFTEDVVSNSQQFYTMISHKEA